MGKMDDIGARLDRLMLDCFAIRRQLGAAANQVAQSGNFAELIASALPADGEPVAVPAYSQIAPGICIGFEPNKGVRITARCATPQLAGATSAADAIEIAIDEIGNSGWLTLEFTWRWEAVTPKRSVHILMEAAFLPRTTIRPKLRYKTFGGKSRDLDSGSFHIGSAGELLVASIILPEVEDPLCDFDTPPSVILFMDTVPGLLTLAKLFFW